MSKSDKETVKKVKRLIHQLENPNYQKIYREALRADDSTIALLRRTGANIAAQGLAQDGASFLIDEEGKLKGGFELGLTPQAVDALMKSANKRALAETLTNGSDLFKELRSSDFDPDSKDLRALCDAAPLEVRKQYITAVSRALKDGSKAKSILQEMVDDQTGFRREGEVNSHSFDSSSGSLRDRVDRGISYLSKALELPTPKSLSLEGSEWLSTEHVPAAYVLEQFIRSLPRERFDIDPSVEPTSWSSKHEKTERPVSSEKQAEIDDVTAMFFKGRGKGGGVSGR